jgi:hypothetical protein
MKNKVKTHKATVKRLFVKGAIKRQQRQHRAQRFARGTLKKDSNTDGKALKLAPVEMKRVKRLLAGRVK